MRLYSLGYVVLRSYQGLLWRSKYKKNHATMLWHYTTLCSASEFTQNLLMNVQHTRLNSKHLRCEKC